LCGSKRSDASKNPIQLCGFCRFFAISLMLASILLIALKIFQSSQIEKMQTMPVA
jgi:hypothetical protein